MPRLLSNVVGIGFAFPSSATGTTGAQAVEASFRVAPPVIPAKLRRMAFVWVLGDFLAFSERYRPTRIPTSILPHGADSSLVPPLRYGARPTRTAYITTGAFIFQSAYGRTVPRKFACSAAIGLWSSASLQSRKHDPTLVQHLSDAPSPTGHIRPIGTKFPCRAGARQAGWHVSAQLEVPSNFTIVPLAPKSPESTRRRTSGNACVTTGSRSARSPPTTPSSIIAATPGTNWPPSLG
jgi:hypothetical protein